MSKERTIFSTDLAEELATPERYCMGLRAVLNVAARLHAEQIAPGDHTAKIAELRATMEGVLGALDTMSSRDPKRQREFIAHAVKTIYG